MNGPWVEKYRPQTLDEVVGQDHIIQRLKRYIEEGSMPNLMFTGPAGVGKTTMFSLLLACLHLHETLIHILFDQIIIF